MATTTNYSWSTPDDTALVKDGAAAIRTLGSSIDTTTKALNPSTTLGDIEYRSATANTNTRLPIGTSGQVLAVNGSGVPAWTTPGGGAKVVQVVNVVNGTQVFSSSSTFADTGLTATITPTSASNKILVILSQSGLQKRNSNTAINLRLFRNATQIATPASETGENDSSLRNDFGSVAMTILDSPATTSAVTYKTTFNSHQNTNGVYCQFAGSQSSFTLMEVTP